MQLGAEQEARQAVAQMANQTAHATAARITLDKRNLAFKQKESAIAERLRQATAISELDALHTTAGAETQEAQVEATSAQAALERSASKMSIRDRDARLATVRISIAQAEAEVEKLKAQMNTLDYEIERRTVRAPVDGVLADVMSVSLGMSLTTRDRVATVLPAGRLRVVALFAPEDSVGRVRAGQSAALRLDNFPWTQFGTVSAVVEQVAREPRDGTIRVELSVPKPNPAIPMEHGLTGVCEIEAEHTSPMKLLLRSAGHFGVPAEKPVEKRSAPASTDGPIAMGGSDL
jgi:membrane fusion protein (multidrug efflux system)